MSGEFIIASVRDPGGRGAAKSLDVATSSLGVLVLAVLLSAASVAASADAGGRKLQPQCL